MRKNDIEVAAHQEKLLSENYPLYNPPDYTLITRNRSTEGYKGGGLCFIVHNTVHHKILELKCPNSDNHIEQQAIESFNGENNYIKLINVCTPRQSSCATGYTATLNHLLTLTNTLIAGAVNDRNQLWHSNLGENQRGQPLTSEVDESNLLVLKEKQPTRLTETTQVSPDTSLAHSNLATNIDWALKTALGSDHSSITLRLTCDITTLATPHKTFINFKRHTGVASRKELKSVSERLNSSKRCTMLIKPSEESSSKKRAGTSHKVASRLYSTAFLLKPQN